MSPLKETYSASDLLPQGFKCSPIHPQDWEDRLTLGIQKVDERMAQSAADRILLPSGEKARDRSFSVVFSHHAVPKYSTADFFLSAELPELLRVTDLELRLYPLISAGPGDELLHVRLSENRRRLESVASQLGFDLQIKVSPTAEGKLHRGEIEPGFDMLGVFRRR